MGEQVKKFWITKWWSTRGILEEWCEVVHGVSGNPVRYASNRPLHIFVVIGKDAFETEEAAKRRVIDLAGRKIKALEKQIAKVEKLRAAL